jgi:hypothetical protein
LKLAEYNKNNSHDKDNLVMETLIGLISGTGKITMRAAVLETGKRKQCA